MRRGMRRAEETIQTRATREARSARGFRAKRGVALLLVLGIVVVFSVGAMTYLTSTTVRTTGAKNLLLASRARYLAESGVQHAIYLLRAKPELMSTRVSEATAFGPCYADANSGDWYKFYAVADLSNPLIYTVYAFSSVDHARGESSCRIKLSSKFAATVQAMSPSHWWRLGDAGLTAANQVAMAQAGTYTNGTARNQPGAIIGDTNKSASFDGLDDYVDLQKMDLPAAGNFTMAAWVKVTSPVGSGGRFLCKATGTSSNSQYWSLGTTVSSGRAQPMVHLKTNQDKELVAGAADAIALDQWTLIAASFDHAYLRLYKDGVQLKRTKQKQDLAVNNTVKSWIGNNPPTATNAPFHGQIDEVMIFPRALSVQEIDALRKARVASVEILSWDEQ